jgi:hypothetical protein
MQQFFLDVVGLRLRPGDHPREELARKSIPGVSRLLALIVAGRIHRNAFAPGP